MFTKNCFGLGRILLSRSNLINKSYSLNSFNLSTLGASCLLKNKSHNRNILDFSYRQIISSSFLFNNSPNDAKQNLKSIINSTPDNVSSDLKNIMAQKFNAEESSQDKNEEKINNNQKNETNESTGRFAKLFSREHAWKYSLAFFAALFGGTFAYVLVSWGGPRLDENNQPMMKDPSTDKLLPEPIQPPYYQPPYTLVVELTGILLHPEWTFSTGWRYKKRPGLDYFLEQVKYPNFELVFFTREPYLAGSPIANSLDPQGQVQFKLYRESTKMVNNTFVKDLSYMNRDLSKIILIDWDDKAYQLQPRNGLHRLKKWEGDEDDTDLVYLAAFLKTIGNSNVADVRDVLDYYNQEPNPLEAFKINHVKLMEAEEKRRQELEELKNKQKKSIFGSLRK